MFVEIEREREEINHRKTKRMLSHFAPQAVNALATLLINKDGNLKARASTAILDRAGFSPSTINVSQVVNNTTQIALFSNADQPLLTHMVESAHESQRG